MLALPVGDDGEDDACVGLDARTSISSMSNPALMC